MASEEQRTRLRRIPQIDALLRGTAGPLTVRYGLVRTEEALRQAAEKLREEILRGNDVWENPEAALLICAEQALAAAERTGVRRVVNATGVTLHTNLGRAPLAKEAVAAAVAAAGYCNLEYDLMAGQRGSRNLLIEPLLCELAGCEAALVVNNNAAAILLAIGALAKGKRVPISRGELVEIGDGFRILEILTQSGCRPVEVGATNRTATVDYETVLRGGRCGAVLRVHPSNFQITGFTKTVPTAELAVLAHRYGLPLVVDLGSGALLEQDGLPVAETTLPQTLRDGADLVCMSGDKLLGGPQAGILAGKQAVVEILRKHPLYRALRPDKMTIAALAATLMLYREPHCAQRQIPTLRMLAATKEELLERATRLLVLLRETGTDASLEVIETVRPVGGGTAPGQALPGAAVAVRPRCQSVGELEKALRAAEPPVIARIAEGRVLLELATIEDEEFAAVAAAMRKKR